MYTFFISAIISEDIESMATSNGMTDNMHFMQINEKDFDDYLSLF